MAGEFTLSLSHNCLPLLSHLNRSRGLATGISAALNYVFAFIATKTYLNVERDLGLPGAPWFYAAFAIFGAGILYLILPETEGRTLEDIERHFSEKGRSIMERKIRKYTAVSGKDPEVADKYKQKTEE